MAAARAQVVAPRAHPTTPTARAASAVLWSAGSPIEDAEALIRRYCGLAEPGAEPTVWGYEYFDARPSVPDDALTPEDVMAVAALSGRFTREALEGFVKARPLISSALAQLPHDLPLEAAGPDHVSLLDALVDGLVEGEGPFASRTGADRGVVSKVLHRKRPRLVAPFDRLIADRYVRLRRLGRSSSYGAYLRAIRDDLTDARNVDALRAVQARLAVSLDGRPVPSRLRLFDIAVWMSERGDGRRGAR